MQQPLRLAITTALTCVSLASLQANQFQGIGSLLENDYSSANAISGDGLTVVGLSYDEFTNVRSFRWTAADGMQVLPVINYADWYAPDGDGYGYGYTEASAVSYNGSVIVGKDYNLGSEDGGTRQAYRWTAGATPTDAGTITGLPYADPDYSFSIARDVSADGSVVVGAEGGYYRAFRWTAAGGTVILGSLDGYAEATGVSADGRVVAGTVDNQAFHWTEGDDPTDLKLIVVPGADTSEAYAISADGSTIVGSYDYDHAFAWNEISGVTFLTALPDAGETHAHAVSGDGRWAVGHSGVAVIWDTTTGEAWDLNELFSGTLDFEGWFLQSATGISDDGLTITGMGTNPDGRDEGWIATLASHPGTVPEPSTYAAFAGLATLVFAITRRRLR